MLNQIADAVTSSCVLAALLALALGLLGALGRVLVSLRRLSRAQLQREIWIGFAGWIILALEFALAADVAHTAVSPNWTDIEQLAAIAAIRTVLNFFLARDLEKFAELKASPQQP